MTASHCCEPFWISLALSGGTLPCKCSKLPLQVQLLLGCSQHACVTTHPFDEKVSTQGPLPVLSSVGMVQHAVITIGNFAQSQHNQTRQTSLERLNTLRHKQGRMLRPSPQLAPNANPYQANQPQVSTRLAQAPFGRPPLLNSGRTSAQLIHVPAAPARPHPPYPKAAPI